MHFFVVCWLFRFDSSLCLPSGPILPHYLCSLINRTLVMTASVLLASGEKSCRRACLLRHNNCAVWRADVICLTIFSVCVFISRESIQLSNFLSLGVSPVKVEGRAQTRSLIEK